MLAVLLTPVDPSMKERRLEARESCSWPGIMDARRIVSEGSPKRRSSSVKRNAGQWPVWKQRERFTQTGTIEMKKPQMNAENTIHLLK